MHATRKALMAGAALLLSLSGGANAATRVQATNEFVDATGKYSFSLSLTSTAGNVGTTILPDLGSPFTVSGTSRNYEGVVGNGDRFSVSVFSSGGTVTSGVYRGSGAAIKAPIGADGKAFAGSYLGIDDSDARGSGLTTFNFIQGRYQLPVKSATILWGSVGSSDLLTVGTGKIAGSEILAAASALGMAGGNMGSFYVTLNALAGSTFTSLEMNSGAQLSETAQVEWAPLSYSATRNDYLARDAYVVPAAPSPGAAPAPLPALAGTLPGLLAVLGATRWSRARRRGTA